MKRRFLLIAGLLVALTIASSSTAWAHYKHYVDDACNVETNTYFWAAGPAQFWRVHSGTGYGFANCHMYTGTTTTGTVNYAAWYLPNLSSYNHDYYVRHFNDADSHCNTQNARHRRYRNGTGAGITETYRWNMDAYNDAYKNITDVNSPPSYDHFYATNGGYMTMSDYTGESGRYTCADQLRYDPIAH